MDDSASVRAVLRRFFARTSDIQVVGEAPDGLQAVEAVLSLQPDVVVMDLQMPVMDGYTAIEQIMARRPTPILVLSSRANRNEIAIGFEAIRRGALEVLPKPEDTESWKLLANRLPEMVRVVAGARPVPRPRASPAAEPPVPDGTPRPLRWVAVGASTGGPLAIHELLEAMPRQAPVSVLVVQHIADGFDTGLAEWLNKELAQDVRLARDGERPRPGAVRLAPAGSHLRLASGGTLHLDAETPPHQGHRPSVDELFFSCAESYPRETAGVLLSGMGNDGVEGLGALHRAGAITLVQDEASSAVFGMPRVALERGAATLALPPRAIARAIARSWQREEG